MRILTRAERAQLAMVLEVSAYPKPGNVDRCHDYPDTQLEHFLASAIMARPAFESAEKGEGGVGKLIHQAVELTSGHTGGNTHFGAFILLIPLVMGDGIPGALRAARTTTVEDALEFYKAFGKTQVRVIPSHELDVHDPASLETIGKRGMTLYDLMLYSAPRDMVAREWVSGFQMTRRGADLLHAAGCGRQAIVTAFLSLLALEPDTFIVKKHGPEVAARTMEKAREVLEGIRDLQAFDQECIDKGINPGSIADIIIASIYIALGEGWKWDCSGTA
ncbi:MAG: triphosphoribosyl-dephospho-CoA synthase [Methanolinea sp.]|nr:triphosphoribosyl-dephospho-CoA synthase [Methanolinea sp.]